MCGAMTEIISPFEVSSSPLAPAFLDFRGLKSRFNLSRMVIMAEETGDSCVEIRFWLVLRLYSFMVRINASSTFSVYFLISDWIFRRLLTALSRSAGARLCWRAVCMNTIDFSSYGGSVDWPWSPSVLAASRLRQLKVSSKALQRSFTAFWSFLLKDTERNFS